MFKVNLFSPLFRMLPTKNIVIKNNETLFSMVWRLITDEEIGADNKPIKAELESRTYRGTITNKLTQILSEGGEWEINDNDLMTKKMIEFTIERNKIRYPVEVSVQIEALLTNTIHYLQVIYDKQDKKVDYVLRDDKIESITTLENAKRLITGLLDLTNIEERDLLIVGQFFDINVQDGDTQKNIHEEDRDMIAE